MDWEIPEDILELTYRVTGAAFRVHSVLGAGLPERIYRESLAVELTRRGIQVEQEVAIPVFYDGTYLALNYFIDLLVEKRLIVELKVVQAITNIEIAQTISYLRLTKMPVAMIYNMNAMRLKDDGFRRVYNPDLRQTS